MNNLVYLVYPAMLIVLFVGAKCSKIGKWNEEFLDYGQTKCFQGFLAICIMIHHIAQEMCAVWQPYNVFPGLEFFVPLGFLFVGIFMFCSGYGLFVSYEKKSNYLSKSFFRKRVLPVVIGYYVSAWIFYGVRLLMGQEIDSWDKFCYLVGIKLSNPYGWFAFVMPIFYLIFFLVFKFCKRPILVTTIFVFAYTVFGTYINHNDYLMTGQWWYNSVHMFWIGLVVAKYRTKLTAWAKKRYIIKIILCALLLQGAWYLTNYLQESYTYYGEDMFFSTFEIMYNRWICLIGEMLLTTLFGFFILMIGMKVKIGNKFLAFMGTITLEFYLMHGLIIELFSYQFCDVVDPIVRITNIVQMIIVVFVCTIPLSIGLKKICHIFDKRKKMVAETNKE